MASSMIPTDAPIYRYSMCNGMESHFGSCQLPRSDSNSTCPSIATVNCTEGMHLLLNSTCTYYFDSFSFFCIVIPQCFSEGSFRLTNRITNFFPDGSIITQGRIELCANSTYFSLCDHYWNPVDAQVYCRYFLSIAFGVLASSKEQWIRVRKLPVWGGGALYQWHRGGTLILLRVYIA